MTRKEAIAILKDDLSGNYWSGLKEAMTMAIKSLEAWDKVEADILGLDGYYDDAFWEGTYAVSKIIDKRLAEVTK